MSKSVKVRDPSSRRDHRADHHREELRILPGSQHWRSPQDLKYKGEDTATIIGDHVTIRECATVHRAVGEGNETRIGNNVLMMAYTHVAHNCIVGNNVIMSNVATLPAM